MSHASKVRLGHVIRPGGGDTQTLKEISDLCSGATCLAPRPPRESAAVGTAERLLGVSGDDRPVYAFVGDLHPELGTVGLVIERTWLANQAHDTGLTRCDSGALGAAAEGLVFSGYESVEGEEKARAALERLHVPAEQWPDAFDQEIASAHGDELARYVRGEQPSLDEDDPRTTFMNDTRSSAEGAGPDRRQWTWEARLTGGPAAEEILLVVLSSRLRARVKKELMAGGAALDPAKVAYEDAELSSGPPFRQPSARRMLAGGAA